MNQEIKLGIGIGLVVIVVMVLIFLRRRPRKLSQEKFADKWKELQKFCRDQSTWPEALKTADKLLDEALKRRKFRGKSMGERMVSAQRILSDNDAIWFAHNITKKVLASPRSKVKKSDIKRALIGYRQALRDLGALPGEASE